MIFLALRMADISGSWLGTYWQHQPVRFEMTLVQGGTTISGNILDDSYLGEASLTGTVNGRSVSFVKSYVGGARHQVRYSGTVSRKGDYMEGVWSIYAVSGAWSAQRHNDTFSLEFKQLLEEKQPATLSTYE